MKPIFRSFLATSVILVAGPLVAQSTPASLVRLDESTLAQLRAKQSERAKHLEPALAKLLPRGFAANNHSMKPRTTEVDMYGRTLARYDHYFHGIRVEGSEAIGLLRADGTTERMDYPFTSLLEPPIAVLNALVPQGQAIALAKKALRLSPGELSESSSELVLTPIIERQFRVFPTANPGGPEGADPSQSVRALKGWRLVHVIQHYLPMRGQAFTTSVDAQTGEMISHGANASDTPGIQGVAQFNRSNGSAIVPLPGTQYGSAYYLQRGNLFSVNIGDVLNPIYSNSSSTFGDGTEYISGQPSSVNGQTQAVDIFYGISSTYDFYLILFNRHSIDGNDGYFIPIAAHHPNTNGAPALSWWYRNAWGQENYWIDFTDRYNPAIPGGPTELSVTAHEWTHGVNRRCSRVGTDSRDTDEAKAINEATSTIMSTAVRFWDSTGRFGGIGIPDPTRWTYDWVYEPQVLGGYPGRPDPVGVEYLYRPSHPNVRFSRYEPSWWTASKSGWTTDVHGIGAPLHRLFYFLANGAPAMGPDHTDQSDNARGRTTPFMPLGFNGVGINDATLIYYQALTQTFTLHMDLLNAGQAIQQAADQRFGAGSSASRITASALAAVNLAAPPTYTFPSNQTHLTSSTALLLPSLEHVGYGAGQLAMDSSSEYYRVTVPAGVSLTAATNAILDLATPSQQGPGIQILDASGTTVILTANPVKNPVRHGPFYPTLDPPPDPPDLGPTFVSVSAKATWRNTSSAPITYLVRVFSPQTRAQVLDYSINTRLDIREITSVDSQATLW